MKNKIVLGVLMTTMSLSTAAISNNCQMVFATTQPTVEYTQNVFATTQPTVEYAQNVFATTQPTVEYAQNVFATTQPMVEHTQNVSATTQPTVGEGTKENKISQILDEIEGFGQAVVYAKETILEGEGFEDVVVISKDLEYNYTVVIEEEILQMAFDFWEETLWERTPRDFSQPAKKEDLAMVLNDTIRGSQMTELVHGYTDTMELGVKYRWRFDFAYMYDILPVDQDKAIGVGEDITASYLREVLDNFTKYLFADYDNFMTETIELALAEEIENPYLTAAYIQGLIPDYVMSLDDELTINSHGVSVAFTNLCVAINHPFVVK